MADYVTEQEIAGLTFEQFRTLPLYQRAGFIINSPKARFAEADAARYWLKRWEGRYESQAAANFWLDCPASDFPWTGRLYDQIVCGQKGSL